MTAPQRNTAATPESNDGVAAPAVGPASVTEKHTLTVDPMEGVICDCHGTPAMCSYCRAAEKDARDLRILSALYAHWHTEDEQAARVARFRLAEGFDVWCFEDGEPRDGMEDVS